MADVGPDVDVDGLEDDEVALRVKELQRQVEQLLQLKKKTKSLPGERSAPINGADAGYVTQAAVDQSPNRVPATVPAAPSGEWRQYALPLCRLCNHRFTNKQARKQANADLEYDDIYDDSKQYFSVVLYEKFALLKDLAEEEDWGTDFKYLRMYLDHTFRRAAEQSSEKRTILGFFRDGAEEPSLVVFHTRLFTKKIEPLYGFFHVNAHRGPNRPKWFLYGFQTEPTMINSGKMRVYHHAQSIPKQSFPEPPTFWDDPSQLLYDPRVPVEETLDYVHMFGAEISSDRRQRLPSKYRQLPFDELVARFDHGFTRALRRVNIWPHTAVPQFFRDKNTSRGDIQLLLPIVLDFDLTAPADCVVVLRRQKDQASEVYIPVTLLSDSLVQLHCRLVMPIHQNWLDGMLRRFAERSGTEASSVNAPLAAKRVGRGKNRLVKLTDIDILGLDFTTMPTLDELIGAASVATMYPEITFESAVTIPDTTPSPSAANTTATIPLPTATPPVTSASPATQASTIEDISTVTQGNTSSGAAERQAIKQTRQAARQAARETNRAARQQRQRELNKGSIDRPPSKAQEDAMDKRKVFVGNVSAGVTAADVAQLAKSLIGEAPVEFWMPSRANSPSGNSYCVITFGSDKAARKAINALNQSSLHGASLLARPYTRKGQ